MIRRLANLFQPPKEILLVPHRAGMLAFEGRSIRLSPFASKIIEALTAAKGQVVTEDTLARVLWPVKLPGSWRNMLAHRVCEARKALPKDSILTVTRDETRENNATRVIVGWRLAIAIKIEDFT